MLKVTLIIFAVGICLVADFLANSGAMESLLRKMQETVESHEEGIRNREVELLLARAEAALIAEAGKKGNQSNLLHIDPAWLVSLPPSFRRSFDKPWQTTTVEHESGARMAVGLLADAVNIQFLSLHQDFKVLMGKRPRLKLLAERDYKFAHEAPVYLPKTNEVFFVSNRLGRPSSPHVDLHAINLKTLAVRDIPTTFSGGPEGFTPPISMANGAATYGTGLAVAVQGGKEGDPAGIAALNPYSGLWDWLVNTWHGQAFNGCNDLVLDWLSAVWFTDPAYGYYQGFKNKPQLPAAVWRFMPGEPARMMADGFDRVNGIAFSEDYLTLYVSDSGSDQGAGSEEPLDPDRPHTIYAFDVLLRDGEPFLANRRVFALVDYGIPDGIKTDNQGNVYASTWEGVSIWNPGGILLGKVITNSVSANFCFVGNDLVILAETRIFRLYRR